MVEQLEEARVGRSRRGPRLSPQQRRLQIIEAAAKLLSEQGLDAVRIPAVADAAGVSRPVVYRHFFSRDELIAGIAEELWRRNQEVFERAVAAQDADSEPNDVWRRAVDLHFDVISELGPTTVRSMLIPTSEAGRQRIGNWVQWVSTLTGVPIPLASSLLHLSVSMLCCYVELWQDGVLTREQAVDLPVRSVLWHAEQLRDAAAAGNSS